MQMVQIVLKNCFGFVNEFSATLDQFTVLVGPNNGGKTSVLRGIQFALDAFRTYFGEGPEPSFAKGKESHQWVLNIADQVRRLGIQDISLLSYGRNQNTPASVRLLFQDDVGLIELEVGNKSRLDALTLNLVINGEEISRGKWMADEARVEAVLARLHRLRCAFVPPLGTISPSETTLSGPEMQNALAAGRYAETWRNQLHWQSEEGRSPEAFQRVARVVRENLGDVEVLLPRRTRQDNPPKVVVEYREDGVEYDISAAGGGLRTLVTLAATMALSPAKILLLDEPDAHLHSSLQRRVARLLVEQSGTDRQVIISTHAPDMIDEVPIDSLRWVDRKNCASEACDETGKTLVRLGAISQSQAIQSLGSDVLLYFEDKPDKTALTSLLKRCGKHRLADRARPALLKGFGDTANLPGALRVLKALLPQMRVAVAAIRDADYTQTDPKCHVDDQKDVFLLTLPFKELENILLLSPQTVARAGKRAADARAAATNQPVESPTTEEVEQKIVEFTTASDVREAIQKQWEFRWLQDRGGLTDPGQLKTAEKEFEARWSDLSWRRRCCPGKMVLGHLRRWLSDKPWKLSVGLGLLFECVEPDAELQAMFDRLDEYVTRETTP